MNNFALKRRVLIVGEGRETEYNYFVGFRNAFEKELRATATSVKVARGNGGDARGIVKNAIKEAKKFQPDPRHGDRVFLLLDTEGAGRAPELPEAEWLAKKNGIEIIYSCPAIEYWLLCHFEKTPESLSKIAMPLLWSLTRTRDGSPSAKIHTTRLTKTFLVDCRTCWI